MKAFKNIKIGDKLWFVDFNNAIISGFVYSINEHRHCFGVVWDDGIISRSLSVADAWDNSISARCTTNYEAAQEIFYKDISHLNMELRR